MNKCLIKNIALLSAIACALCACSPKEEACDMTGKKYGKMMTEGVPFTEKDKACMQALIIKGFQDLAAKPLPPIEYETAPPHNWNMSSPNNNLKK